MDWFLVNVCRHKVQLILLLSPMKFGEEYYRGVPIIGSADMSASDMGIVISVISVILHWEPIFAHAHCTITLFNANCHIVITK